MADISISNAYQQVLGRTPSAEEIAYWQSQFGSSVDPVELSNFSVAAQPELKAAAPTNTAVRDMYQQVLGRAPDASGLQYFADRFGTSIDPTELGIFKSMAAEEIAANAAKQTAAATQAPTQAQLQAAAQQAEAARAAATATTTTGMSIANAYQQVLGRAPSASEVAYWTSQFGADVDPTELSKFSVAAQPERAAAPTTNNAIRQMYLSVLGREPDASGLKYFSDRFGADVDANELGIFKGMSTQEINANAARNAKTTATTAGAITRPTTPTQVTGTQLAPASVTNTAITGTPYTNIYTPATIQQNAPTLAQINAASQSANPYQSLMALTPQRTISPAYAGMLGQTAANTNLGGYNPAIYNPAAATTAATGLLNTTGGGGINAGDARGPGSGNTSTGQTGYGTVANLAGEAQRYGFNNLGGFIASAIPVGGTYNRTDLTTGLPVTGSFTTADLAALGNRSAIAAINAQNQAIAQDAEQQSSGSPFDNGDSGRTSGGNYGGDAYGGSYNFAKGGMVNMNPQMHNPPGPDDGYAALDNGEYVIRKSAVKKYGSNIFEQINAGKIPAQRLKSLLE